MIENDKKVEVADRSLEKDNVVRLTRGVIGDSRKEKRGLVELRVRKFGEIGRAGASMAPASNEETN